MSKEFVNPVGEDVSVGGDNVPDGNPDQNKIAKKVGRAQEVAEKAKDVFTTVGDSIPTPEIGQITEAGKTAFEVVSDSTLGVGALMRYRKMKSIDDKFDKIFRILSHLQKHIAKTDIEVKDGISIQDDDLVDDRAIETEIKQLETLNNTKITDDTDKKTALAESSALLAKEGHGRPSLSHHYISSGKNVTPSSTSSLPPMEVEERKNPSRFGFLRKSKLGGGKKTKKKKKKTKKRKNKKSKKTKRKKK